MFINITCLFQVYDIDQLCLMVGEAYECTNCKKKYQSWNQTILDQLLAGYHHEFNIIMTSRLAATQLLATMLRHRGLGNGP